MGSEVIEVVERRRRWPVEVRLKILEEVLAPGASVAAVADRHGVSRGLVYQWLSRLREGRMRGLSLAPEPVFAAVRIGARAGEPSAEATAGAPSEPASPPPVPSSSPEPVRPPRRQRIGGTVEIRLGNGRVVRVDEGIDPAALGAIVAALDGDGR